MRNFLTSLFTILSGLQQKEWKFLKLLTSTDYTNQYLPVCRFAVVGSFLTDWATGVELKIVFRTLIDGREGGGWCVFPFNSIALRMQLGNYNLCEWVMESTRVVCWLMWLNFLNSCIKINSKTMVSATMKILGTTLLKNVLSCHLFL